ncbi:FxsA family protein [Enterovibrio paralichthyis]|uniref:FxsA family protein n=1 Tax=Enterovibrio paralichthyis TaxID=2853805 RepID=UPI001C471EAC|nr:membrane protein FxsA [Enterovibrio paralichthyis]
MFPILLLMFITVPVIEIALFIQVGGILGLWPTVALILITAIVGASLVRSQGLQTLVTVQQRMQKGELPAQQIVEGVMLAVAGVLLLTPGFMTDAMGMAVLLPWPRAWLAKQLMGKIKVANIQTGFGGQQGPYGQDPFQRGPYDSQQGGNTFEGEYQRKDEDRDRLN